MDPATRTIRLAAYLMARGLPTGDLGSGLEERVLQALAAVPAFGRPEVDACLAIGDASAPLLVERLNARPAAAPAPVAAAPAAAPAAAAPEAPAPAATAPAAADEPVFFEEELRVEISGFLASHAKFKTVLQGLPARVAENDSAYSDMLMTHYNSRESKQNLGIRPAVLLARFVEMWREPDARPRARLEYSLVQLFPPGEVP
jgi:hypothetical protein